ncbi:MAG: DUF2259 domain-containing protein [Treponema sp.]|nr:DUF2259 domain-containing protein [Treponema sp.]MCL2271810.1 DUF2259 domain-containing protein [Treponema sp.]
MKKSLLIILVFFVLISGLWGGDTAVFVDLGFSPDGKTYMFGQYGVLSPSLKPWAEIFIVDMDNNNFVPNGKANYMQNAAIKAGQDGSGVFYQLLNNNSDLASRYRINFQNQGQPLYISRDENPPQRGEIVTFRDFLWGKSYKAQLIPVITGSGLNVRSSFHISLDTVHPNGLTSIIKVGNPQIVRPGIASYNINKVLIDEKGNSLIFVIEMKRAAENGFDTRYMVEAVRF